MATISEYFVFKDNMLRNRYIYPAGCNPVWNDIVYHPYQKVYTTKYVRESRQKPKYLLSSMTSRERVITQYDTRGVYWNSVEVPCPHSGVHGNVIQEAYTTDVSNANLATFLNLDSEISKNHWATRLREEIGSRQVNLGSSLAEYRESCKMFAGLAKGLWNAYKTLRGKRRRRRIKVRDIPASVLQYNFGVSPLVNDVYDSVERLRNRLDEPVVQRYSTSIKRTYTPETSYANFDFKGVCTFKQRATVYVIKSDFAGLNGDFDFGNPVEWAWELIPFSFVVDWAIPIGTWLGQLDAMVGVSLLSGCVTTKCEAKAQYHPTGYNRIMSEGVFTARTYERQVITSVPHASFPDWSPSLSGKRAINATALLWLLLDRFRS